MYCGDETGAFIGDVGSFESRFGYGGEDNPKHVVYSIVGNNNGGNNKRAAALTSTLHDRFSNYSTPYRMADTNNNLADPCNYLMQGDCIENWDAYQELWQEGLDVLRARHPNKHTTGRTSTSSGVSSTTILPSTRCNNNRDEPCAHPLLATSHGNTHSSVVVRQNGSTEDTATTTSVMYQSALHREELTQTAEILLEQLRAPACFVAPTPVLSAFSYGRQTCLVVDVGSAGTRVTPVVDGLLLKHAQRRNGRGGNWLGSVALRALSQSGIVLPVVPRYQVPSNNNKNTKQSASCTFHQMALMDCMYELRTIPQVELEPWSQDDTVPFVNMDTDVEMKEAAAVPDPNNMYQLPDGTRVDLESSVGRDLCRIPELLFTDEVPFVVGDAPNAILRQSPTLTDVPLPKLIQASLAAVGDADARKELCGNIVLCGGSSLFANLEKRLSYELSNTLPATFKCRVLASNFAAERKHAAWIGGSILTSLGSFQQLWLSQTEYEEYGATLAIQRFP